MKQKITLLVKNIIGDPYGVEAEDGQKVFEHVTNALKAKKQVKLSFENIELLTTAFLNNAVGQLYRDHKEAFIKNNLSVAHLENWGEILLKRVVNTAKLYYNDPEALKKSIKEFED